MPQIGQFRVGTKKFIKKGCIDCLQSSDQIEHFLFGQNLFFSTDLTIFGAANNTGFVQVDHS